MNIYESIKAAISVKQSAEHYGLKVSRNGMACCPFHNDRHPSLKLNEEYFFCFGCGAKGDVIDFVARLFDLSSYEAAQRLAADLGISTEPGQPVAVPHKLKHPYIRQFREDEMLCFRVLTDYLHLLEDWKVWYAPKTPDDALDDRFVEACQMIDYIEYLADILTVGDLEERVAVVDELMKKLSSPMQQAVTGALNRSSRRRNPRYNEIDWKTTIEKNLRNYQPEYKTIIPEVRIGFGRKRRALKDIVLCLDQSGSMGASVVYSGIFGSVLASIPSVQTRMVVFDTSVVDLTDDLQDPVDLLFGVQLGGGTDIDRALGYCQTVITRPADTVLVLVTDLCEGGNEREMRKKMISLVQSGVQLIVLLALNDDGAPFYDKENAQFLAELGVPAFACTPDKFPDLMAAALAKQDIGMWLSKNIQ